MGRHGRQIALIPAATAALLQRKANQYNQLGFIETDPIRVPHQFSGLQDREIMGFWTAVLAWGQRPVILRKAQELVERMDGAPYDFVRNHTDADAKQLLGFRHRTFNDTDALYFLHFFRQFYQTHTSLEEAFVPTPAMADAPDVGPALVAFHRLFCDTSGDNAQYFPARTAKHIASPARHSTCKRLLMFLRWMVRHDDRGVDFGIWKRLNPNQLVMPIDVHVARVSRRLGLLPTTTRLVEPAPTWETALALTESLRSLDANDPVRFDFALFGLGAEGEL